MNKFTRSALLFTLVCLTQLLNFSKGQTIIGQDSTFRVITPAVPFLLIAPDSRSAGMADVGAATSPDANSVHWNIGKLAFNESEIGINFSYTPWLGKIVDDMYIAYLSGYYKLDQEQAVALSMRYFDLGDIQFTDKSGNPLRPFNPREYSFDLAYSRKLSDKLGIGVAARYVYSNLAGDANISGSDTQPGQSVAADLGLYYNNDLTISNLPVNFALGASISNVGNKISYLNEDTENFIPGNFRLGTAFTADLDPYNKLTFALDFNKLLVPTPPVYEVENGEIVYENGKPKIKDGKDPNRSLISGTFSSFADAPGGFSEELKEVTVGAGLEYWYNNLFAVRTGYFYEHEMKGNRKFFTLGVGLRYQVIAMDFAYLIPTDRELPLAETIRATFGVYLNNTNPTDKSIRE